MEEKIICPHCQGSIQVNYAKELGLKRKLTSEHQKMAINARWKKYREAKAETVDNSITK